MWIATALLAMLGTFAVAYGLVRGVRRIPPGIRAPLALALLVCFEAVALELLSLAHAVTRAGVVIAHLVAIAAVLVFVPVSRRALQAAPRRVRRTIAGLGIAGLLLAPLFVLLALSAVRYAPNNWDSMTYHLARVAHWIQNRSVEAFPTNIPRQVALGPGAEYLLLALQVVSGSDALASLVQLGCWLVLAVSAPSLARLAGVPRRASRWAAPIVASAPMFVLQASSTQNDLVAAVMTVAIVAASLRFRGGRAATARTGDWLLLAGACSAGLLVKPISLIVALPFISMAGWKAGKAIVRGPQRARVLRSLGAGLLLAACVAGPPTLRGIGSGAAEAVSQYLFPLTGEWVDRGLNALRGAAHHVPLPRSAADALGLEIDAHCGVESFCTKVVFRPHEDYGGNPVQAGLVLAMVSMGLLRWWRLPPRSRAALAAVAASWVLFHLVVRENVWVSRLQTPLFALIPLSLAGAASSVAGARPRQAAIRGALAAVAVVSLIVGHAFAVQNVTRPPLGDPPWAAVRYWSYYANRSSVLPLHDQALDFARGLGCARLGLWIGGDSYDYPLTWRAMQAGISVRHVIAADSWPCVIFSDPGRSPPPGFEAAGWVSAGFPYIFVNYRALATERDARARR